MIDWFFFNIFCEEGGEDLVTKVNFFFPFKVIS